MSNPTVNLLDLMTDEDRAKIKAREIHIEQVESGMMTKEWLSICEFGMYYGWSAIQSFRNDEITIDEMYQYIKGARKIHASHIYDHAIANIARNGNFDKVMAEYIKDMKEVI